MRIAVLALQGAFAEHQQILDKMGIENYQIRKKADLRYSHDGIIIPGGESTVMAKLLQNLELMAPIRKEIESGMPVFGTCAGLVLLANMVENDEMQGIKTMDIVAKRNAYGRQLGSFYTKARFAEWNDVPMTFIRAPYIVSVSENVEILASVDEKIVAARQKNQLVTAFHPELTEDLRIHQYFIEMAEETGIMEKYNQEYNARYLHG